MKVHHRIARFFAAGLPLLFFVATATGQDVTHTLLENGDVLITVDYTMELKEALDHLEFALPSILKQAASRYPDSSLIRLEVSIGGERTGAFEIAASDAVEGARGNISNDEMMSRLRGKPLVDIAARLGQHANTNVPPPSEDFFSKYFPSAEKPSPPPSSSPEEGEEGSAGPAQRPARYLYWIGALIAGIIVLLIGVTLVRRHRRASKNEAPR